MVMVNTVIQPLKCDEQGRLSKEGEVRFKENAPHSGAPRAAPDDGCRTAIIPRYAIRSCHNKETQSDSHSRHQKYKTSQLGRSRASTQRTGHAGDAGDDGEGDGCAGEEVEVPLQLLLVPCAPPQRSAPDSTRALGRDPALALVPAPPARQRRASQRPARARTERDEAGLARVQDLVLGLLRHRAPARRAARARSARARVSVSAPFSPTPGLLACSPRGLARTMAAGRGGGAAPEWRTRGGGAAARAGVTRRQRGWGVDGIYRRVDVIYSGALKGVDARWSRGCRERWRGWL